ncbi:MAG: alpha-galactosidase [Lachnospiraceae bacterium]|nr:alpha-galactosidase [Lachnospiraceae bacterium]
MKEGFTIEENGVRLVFCITEDGRVKLLHYGYDAFEEESLGEEEMRGFRLVEAELAGLDRPEERHGIKYIVTAPGYRMIYDSRKDYRNADGRKLEIVTKDVETGFFITSHFQFYDGIAVIRTWQEAANRGSETQTLTYLSTFVLNGIEKEGILSADDKLRIGIPHHSWQRELQWKFYTPAQLGICKAQEGEKIRSSKAVSVTNTGNWSAKEYLPMGSIENTETGKAYLWQIEHNGSWHWEISDQTGHLYIQLSGPTENESHWCLELAPGESFVSVPAAVTAACGFDAAVGEMTRYRRRIRRKNEDNETLGVIFNDYMNCLWAEPTTEKELPLIEAAQKAGCEYYCIDAGWYSKGYWWDNVGEWQPSRERFPGGIKEVTDIIRAHGMIPGLWLEIEVMGIHCRLAQEVPDDWFFVRHGKRVYDRSRYQLDFRNPQVRAYADSVIDRLVTEYGVGYIKMDYNIEPGIGTELSADSFGDGLLSHERAYLGWLDGIFERYPNLIIENCSSGGLRMDYAMLRRHSIQSTSDQEDYRHYASIAANAPTALAPEQAAVWSYPLAEGDAEETVFNMVNAMLLRIHQSGNLSALSPERAKLVSEGIACYKEIRQDIKQALPFWPIGLSSFRDAWSCLGLHSGNKVYIALWKRCADCDTVALPLTAWRRRRMKASLLYPEKPRGLTPCGYQWNENTGIFSVSLPGQYRARLFVLTEEGDAS